MLQGDSPHDAPPDVTGLIGQYCHGNEPSHHNIYFFSLLGRRDLAAQYIREVMDTQYQTTPTGLCGNDDCGQMSAWCIFSTLGFYPFDPCGGKYVLGEAQMEEISIDVGDVETKWLDFRAEHNAKPSLRSAVWLQFKFASPTELSGYRWYTANDFEDRDPGAWRLLGSNDGANWVMIDQVTGFRATSERNKLAFSRRLPEVK